MVWTATLATLALLLSGAAVAQTVAAQEAPALWRDLHVGDSVAAVKAKLEATPGVKKVRVRTGNRDGAERLAISYTLGGVDIFGAAFKLIPVFEGDKLTQMGLGTEPLCLDEGIARLEKMDSLLREKYPTDVVGPDSSLRSDALSASRRATQEAPTSIITVRKNDQTAVALMPRFFATDPPPTSYMTGRFARAASDFLWQQYESKRSECNGTGLRRVQLALIYVSNTQLDRISSEAMKQAQGEAAKASSNM